MPLPFQYLPFYLQKAFNELGNIGQEDYDAMTQRQRDECKIVDVMDTALIRACKSHIVALYVH